MVIFNELHLSEDLQSMIIDCEIEDTDANPNVFIDNIWIEYYKNRNADTVYSNKAIKVYSKVEDPSPQARKKISVSKSVLATGKTGVTTFENGLFYVIVECYDTTDEEVFYVDTWAVLDWQAVYNIGMNAVAQITASCGFDCSTPDFIEQFVIVWNALRLATEACDIDQVDMLWSRFIAMSGSGLSSKCNCIG